MLHKFKVREKLIVTLTGLGVVVVLPVVAGVVVVAIVVVGDVKYFAIVILLPYGRGSPECSKTSGC